MKKRAITSIAELAEMRESMTIADFLKLAEERYQLIHTIMVKRANADNHERQRELLSRARDVNLAKALIDSILIASYDAELVDEIKKPKLVDLPKIETKLPEGLIPIRPKTRRPAMRLES